MSHANHFQRKGGHESEIAIDSNRKHSCDFPVRCAVNFWRKILEQGCFCLLNEILCGFICDPFLDNATVVITGERFVIAYVHGQVKRTLVFCSDGKKTL